jgi:hypothetical protein
MCGRHPHIPPETTLRNHQPLAYQQGQVLAMRGGLKGNISSCPANPFNFSAPSHQNFHSEAAGVTFFVGGINQLHLSNPAPSCIFSPIMRATFSTYQRGFPAQFSKQPNVN